MPAILVIFAVFADVACVYRHITIAIEMPQYLLAKNGSDFGVDMFIVKNIDPSINLVILEI